MFGVTEETFIEQLKTQQCSFPNLVLYHTNDPSVDMEVFDVSTSFNNSTLKAAYLHFKKQPHHIKIYNRRIEWDMSGRPYIQFENEVFWLVLPPFRK